MHQIGEVKNWRHLWFCNILQLYGILGFNVPLDTGHFKDGGLSSDVHLPMTGLVALNTFSGSVSNMTMTTENIIFIIIHNQHVLNSLKSTNSILYPFTYNETLLTTRYPHQLEINDSLACHELLTFCITLPVNPS